MLVYQSPRTWSAGDLEGILLRIHVTPTVGVLLSVVPHPAAGSCKVWLALAQAGVIRDTTASTLGLEGTRHGLIVTSAPQVIRFSSCY